MAACAEQGLLWSAASAPKRTFQRWYGCHEEGLETAPEINGLSRGGGLPCERLQII